jgi:hypothetical protein
MSQLAAPVLRAIVGVIDFVIGVLVLLVCSERRIAEGSQPGESRADRAARNFYEQIIDWWQWIGIGLLLTALIFGGYWLVRADL